MAKFGSLTRQKKKAEDKLLKMLAAIVEVQLRHNYDTGIITRTQYNRRMKVLQGAI